MSRSVSSSAGLSEAASGVFDFEELKSDGLVSVSLLGGSFFKTGGGGTMRTDFLDSSFLGISETVKAGV